MRFLICVPCVSHENSGIYIKNSLQIPVNWISNTVIYYNSATIEKCPDGAFFYCELGWRGMKRNQSETIRQYSGRYAGTDKKPAVPRDFSCVDFGMGEKCPFLRHNIQLSIQPPCSDSQKTKQVELMRKTFII